MARRSLVAVLTFSLSLAIPACGGRVILELARDVASCRRSCNDHLLVAQHQTAPERRLAQRMLADDITTIVHGEVAAAEASAAADVLFGGDPTKASLATLEVVAREVPCTIVDSIQDLAPLPALLVKTGLCSSLSDARRTLDQQGVSGNGRKLATGATLSVDEVLHERFVLLRKGRSTYHVVALRDGVAESS